MKPDSFRVIYLFLLLSLLILGGRLSSVSAQVAEPGSPSEDEEGTGTVSSNASGQSGGGNRPRGNRKNPFDINDEEIRKITGGPLFPNQSDVKALVAMRAALKDKYKDEVGKKIAGYLKDNWDPNRKINGQKGAFKQHPWTTGPMNTRDIADSVTDWYDDTLKLLGLPSTSGGSSSFSVQDFLECFEPRLIRPICEYCFPAQIEVRSCGDYQDNTGFVWEYWWPENQVEINSAGVSAMNPLLFGHSELVPKVLSDILEQTFLEGPNSGYPINIKSKIAWMGGDPDKVPDKLPAGPEGFHGSKYTGFTGPNMIRNNDVRSYRPEVAAVTSAARCLGCGKLDTVYLTTYPYSCNTYQFWYNGYLKGNDKCFYDTLPPKQDTINAWSEDTRFAPYWRIPEMSLFLRKDLYLDSVPSQVPFTVGGFASDTDFAFKDSGMSYRAYKWPQNPFGYGDLKTLLKVEENDSADLGKIFYKGGGQLYPTVGATLGPQSELVTAGYLARRYAEVLSQRGINNKKCSEQKYGFNRFTSYKEEQKDDDAKDKKSYESIDKLQRVWPTPDGKPSKCFRMQQILSTDLDTFPKDAVTPETMGSVRYIHWNKRTACTCQYRGIQSSCEKDRRNDNSGENYPLTQGMPAGWGCQLYPRDPSKREKARGDLDEGEVEGMGGLIGLLPAQAALMKYPFFEAVNPFVGATTSTGSSQDGNSSGTGGIGSLGGSSSSARGSEDGGQQSGFFE